MPLTEPLTSREKAYTYGSSEYDSLLKELLSDKSSQTLLSFIGPYMPDKNSAVKSIIQQTGLEVQTYSFKDIVNKDNNITRQNIDQAFEGVDPEKNLLFFTNGANLCGNYMGNTFSKVKYATPEERHFLNKVEEFKGIIIVTIRSDDAADETIKRKSTAIINFPLPSSGLKRFGWLLRNYTFHGFKLPDERTEIT